MKSLTIDPWNSNKSLELNYHANEQVLTQFEDSFIENNNENNSARLADSEQYLEKLYTRLKHVKGGTSKKDLVNSLSQVKEDSLLRFITEGGKLQPEEEDLINQNPLIRHITPHLQALTASEQIDLLKADILQLVTDQQNEDIDEMSVN